MLFARAPRCTPVVSSWLFPSTPSRQARSVCAHDAPSKVSWVSSPPAAPLQGTSYDAIVILAGGQTSERESGLPIWVERRLDACADILKGQTNKQCRILCSGGGTPHKPPTLTAKGFCLHEGTACADYLIAQCGVPADRLLKESSSYDTIGNAYFAATIHAVPAGWKRLAIVTSDFHMPRSQAIFETVFRLSDATHSSRTQLDFWTVSDEGIFEDDVLQARVDRESLSQQQFVSDQSDFQRLADFHEWLHGTHRCYAVTRQDETDLPTNVNDKALASY